MYAESTEADGIGRRHKIEKCLLAAHLFRVVLRAANVVRGARGLVVRRSRTFIADFIDDAF